MYDRFFLFCGEHEHTVQVHHSVFWFLDDNSTKQKTLKKRGQGNGADFNSFQDTGSLRQGAR
jgi:hypothetical protein